jgi:hypothetical protein
MKNICILPDIGKVFHFGCIGLLCPPAQLFRRPCSLTFAEIQVCPISLYLASFVPKTGILCHLLSPYIFQVLLCLWSLMQTSFAGRYIPKDVINSSTDKNNCFGLSINYARHLLYITEHYIQFKF